MNEQRNKSGYAEFVKTHPRSVWIKEVKPLIDSQIIMGIEL